MRHTRRYLLVAAVMVLVVVVVGAAPAGAETIHEGGTFHIPEDLALVPDPGLLDAHGCQEGDYQMISGILTYDAKVKEDGDTVKQKGFIDWIDSTWVLIGDPTGKEYGLTERSAVDFKVKFSGDELAYGKGFWLLEWYDLATGEITDYIRVDYDARTIESTCGD